MLGCCSGEIYTVRYEAVNAMLLNEFLKEHCKVAEQQSTNCAPLSSGFSVDILGSTIWLLSSTIADGNFTLRKCLSLNGRISIFVYIRQSFLPYTFPFRF
jgi:hypothetical protein